MSVRRPFPIAQLAIAVVLVAMGAFFLAGMVDFYFSL